MWIKMSKADLPENWRKSELSDVLSLLRNGLVYKKQNITKGLPITRIETISDATININRVGYVKNIKEDLIQDYSLQNGDILFSHINSVSHIGKTAIYRGVYAFLAYVFSMFYKPWNSTYMYILYYKKLICRSNI